MTRRRHTLRSASPRAAQFFRDEAHTNPPILFRKSALGKSRLRHKFVMFETAARKGPILGGAMRCISCCGDMRVVRVDQDSGMEAAGYEHQTLECSGCNKTERRLAFTGDKTFWPAEYWRASIAIDAAGSGLPLYRLLADVPYRKATAAPRRVS
jgi:hypothetical protein